MIAELGYFSLIIAFTFACLLVCVPTLGLYLKKQALIESASSYVLAQFIFVAFSFLCLVICFINNDFTVLYVLSNSSEKLPLFYKICAVWGGHEGSILLWAFLLTCWTVAVLKWGRTLAPLFLTRVLVVLGALSIGFLLFIIKTSNPFLLDFNGAKALGRDLNPLLQDPGFLLHPPMLYMGYVGFSVAFAFSIAALWMGKIDSDAAKWSRPWTLAAWSLLTLGITLGSWWAYRELGWGGWWFWDPVENASFMPWLMGTALIHSLMVTEKRKQFFVSTLLLSIGTFSMSLVGTFLVRSGVLTSVHAFAVDPTRGLYILLFLATVIGGALLLFAVKAPRLKIEGHFNLCAKESFLLMNNLLMTVCMLTVLLGTTYPLIIDGLGLGKLSVGAPYFNRVFVPLFSVVMLFMGIGIQAKWQQETFNALMNKIKVPLCIAFVSAMIFFVFHLSVDMLWGVWGIFLSLFVFLSTSLKWFAHQKARGFFSFQSTFMGMCFAHIGIAVTVMGISISTLLGIQKDVRLVPMESIKLGDYTLTYIEQKKIQGPNYVADVASIKVSKEGYEKIIYPEKRIYDVSQMAMTDADIDLNMFRDIYVAQGEPFPNNAWSFRVYYKPFIRWIWAGGVLIFIGGFLALTDRRYYDTSKVSSMKEMSL